MQSHKFRILPLALAGAIALAATARAEDTRPIDSGPYITFGAGITMPNDKPATLTGTDPGLAAVSGGNPELKWDTGYNVIGAFGYKWPEGLRLEIETGYRRSKLSSFVNDPNTVGGREGIWDVTGDVLYEFNLGPIRPYIGGGVGFGQMRFENVSDGIAGDPTFGGHDTNFEVQGIAGFNIPLTDRLAFFTEYRYIALNGNTIASRDRSAALNGYDDNSNNIIAGLRFALGAPKEAKAAATAPPAPPAPPPEKPMAAPPPPPVPEKVLVFFDFDKANLRSDALQIVRDAANYSKSHSVTVIHLTGYTDTMGTTEYNMALSKRRAMTVKAELVRLGIPENEIDVAWKGKSNLLVPTADQVREPQNRRVEIIYD